MPRILRFLLLKKNNQQYYMPNSWKWCCKNYYEIIPGIKKKHATLAKTVLSKSNMKELKNLYYKQTKTLLIEYEVKPTQWMLHFVPEVRWITWVTLIYQCFLTAIRRSGMFPILSTLARTRILGPKGPVEIMSYIRNL